VNSRFETANFVSSLCSCISSENMKKCSIISIAEYRYHTLANSVTLPLMYFRFNYVTIFACISVTIIVSVNGVDVFQLTGISVTVIVNGKNTVPRGFGGGLVLMGAAFCPSYRCYKWGPISTGGTLSTYSRPSYTSVHDRVSVYDFNLHHNISETKNKNGVITAWVSCK